MARLTEFHHQHSAVSEPSSATTAADSYAASVVVRLRPVSYYELVQFTGIRLRLDCLGGGRGRGGAEATRMAAVRGGSMGAGVS
jgi:hypothetical protein